MYIGRSTSTDDGFEIRYRNSASPVFSINKNGYNSMFEIKDYGTDATSFSTGCVIVGGGLAVDGNVYTRSVDINGSTSGTITVQSVTGTYNFTLPTTSGTSGDFLTSAAGGTLTWSSSASTGTGSFVRAISPTITGTLTAATTVVTGLTVSSASGLPLSVTSASASSLDMARFLAPSAAAVAIILGQTTSGSQHTYWSASTNNMTIGIGGGSAFIELKNNICNVSVSQAGPANIATFFSPTLTSDCYLLVGKSSTGNESCLLGYSITSNTGFLSITGASAALSFDSSGNVTVTRRVRGTFLHAQSLPIPNASGSYIGWNYSGGTGEMNFACQNAGSAGGFSWQQFNNSNVLTGTPMTLSPTAGLTVVGSSAVITVGTAGAGEGAIYLGNSSHGMVRDSSNNVTVQTAGTGEIRLKCGTTPTDRLIVSSTGVVRIPNLGGNKSMYSDGSSNLVSRISGSGAFINTSANTTFNNNTWTRVANLQYATNAGNGLLTIVSGNELRNDTGEQILFSATFSGNRQSNGFGLTRIRIVHTVGELCYADGAATDYLNVAANMYLTSGQSIWFDVYQNSGSNLTWENTRITVTTHPNL
jgi:hypothetical protein